MRPFIQSLLRGQVNIYRTGEFDFLSGPSAAAPESRASCHFFGVDASRRIPPGENPEDDSP